MAIAILNLVVVFVKTLLYSAVSLLIIAFQVVAIFFLFLAPIIFLLTIVPGYGSEKVVASWLQKIIETQISIFALMFVLGFLIKISTIFSDKSPVFGWFVSAIFEIFISVFLVLNYKKVFEVFGFATKAATNSGYARAMLHKSGNLSQSLSKKNNVIDRTAATAPKLAAFTYDNLVPAFTDTTAAVGRAIGGISSKFSYESGSTPVYSPGYKEPSSQGNTGNSEVQQNKKTVNLPEGNKNAYSNLAIPPVEDETKKTRPNSPKVPKNAISEGVNFGNPDTDETQREKQRPVSPVNTKNNIIDIAPYVNVNATETANNGIKTPQQPTVRVSTKANNNLSTNIDDVMSGNSTSPTAKITVRAVNSAVNNDISTREAVNNSKASKIQADSLGKLDAAAQKDASDSVGASISQPRQSTNVNSATNERFGESTQEAKQQQAKTFNTIDSVATSVANEDVSKNVSNDSPAIKKSAASQNASNQSVPNQKAYTQSRTEQPQATQEAKRQQTKALNAMASIASADISDKLNNGNSKPVRQQAPNSPQSHAVSSTGESANKIVSNTKITEFSKDNFANQMENNKVDRAETRVNSPSPVINQGKNIVNNANSSSKQPENFMKNDKQTPKNNSAKEPPRALATAMPEEMNFYVESEKETKRPNIMPKASKSANSEARARAKNNNTRKIEKQSPKVPVMPIERDIIHEDNQKSETRPESPKVMAKK